MSDFARQVRRRRLRETQIAAQAAERFNQDWTAPWRTEPAIDALDQHAMDRMADEGGPAAA